MPSTLFALAAASVHCLDGIALSCIITPKSFSSSVCLILLLSISHSNLQFLLPTCMTAHLSMLNSMVVPCGPSTDPWGTPLVTFIQFESFPLILTLCFLFFSHLMIHWSTLPCIPHACIFLINLLWGTLLSNAFAKSRFADKFHQRLKPSCLMAFFTRLNKSGAISLFP